MMAVEIVMPATAQPSQTRIHRLALHRQNSEDALVHPIQPLVTDEALDGFDPEGEFAQRQRSFQHRARSRRRERLGGNVYSGP